MWHSIHKYLFQLVLAIALVLLIFIGLDNFTTQPAFARFIGSTGYFN